MNNVCLMRHFLERDFPKTGYPPSIVYHIGSQHAGREFIRLVAVCSSDSIATADLRLRAVTTNP
jgi:hypothetical protein